jgi:hypothetical protein
MSALKTAVSRTLEGSVRAFNRTRLSNRELRFMGRHPGYPVYDYDCVVTNHIHSFMEDPGFQRAYQRAVVAGGWDYGIPWRVHVMLWATGVARKAPGAFVECGTGRGFMASAVCEHHGWTDRPFYLVDTFDSRRLAPESADPDENSDTSPHYATSVESVRANFAGWPGVQVVQGRVPEALTQVPVDQVAFLHLDMNHPDPEVAALRHFWPLMPAGGVVLMDDYAFLGCRDQHDALNAAAAELGFTILSLPTGQGLAIKTGFEAPTGL